MKYKFMNFYSIFFESISIFFSGYSLGVPLFEIDINELEISLFVGNSSVIIYLLPTFFRLLISFMISDINVREILLAKIFISIILILPFIIGMYSKSSEFERLDIELPPEKHLIFFSSYFSIIIFYAVLGVGLDIFVNLSTLIIGIITVIKYVNLDVVENGNKQNLKKMAKFINIIEEKTLHIIRKNVLNDLKKIRYFILLMFYFVPIFIAFNFKIFSYKQIYLLLIMFLIIFILIMFMYKKDLDFEINIFDARLDFSALIILILSLIMSNYISTYPESYAPTFILSKHIPSELNINPKIYGTTYILYMYIPALVYTYLGFKMIKNAINFNLKETKKYAIFSLGSFFIVIPICLLITCIFTKPTWGQFDILLDENLFILFITIVLFGLINNNVVQTAEKRYKHFHKIDYEESLLLPPRFYIIRERAYSSEINVRCSVNIIYDECKKWLIDNHWKIIFSNQPTYLCANKGTWWGFKDADTKRFMEISINEEAQEQKILIINSPGLLCWISKRFLSQEVQELKDFLVKKN